MPDPHKSTARELTLDDKEIAERLRYVDFGSADAKRLQAIQPILKREAARITDEFFQHLARFPEAKALFASKTLVEEAKHCKREHLIAIGGGKYDHDYVAQRLRLGKIYSKAGIEAKVFLGAFDFLMRTIGQALLESAKSPAEAFADFFALKKIAFFDVGIIVEVITFERGQTILRQQEAIRELSTPVLQLRERLLILPIIGMIDTYRARLLTENLLRAIRANRAKVVVIDVTGVATVDSKVANHLVQTVAAARLMGATAIVTGLSAEISQTLVTLGVDLGPLTTIGDLQGGIEEAERLLGYKVVRDGQPAPAA